MAPPPATPLETFAGPWEPIEAKLGVVLPPDYKDLVRLYGSGCFMEFVWLMTPRSSDMGQAFLEGVRQAAHAFRVLSLPHSLWPNAGGLVPVGATENNDHLFWLPRAATERWSIVVWDRCGEEGLDTQVFDCDLTDFLAGLMTGDITSDIVEDRVWERSFRPAVV